jgi:hypothetical protein
VRVGTGKPRDGVFAGPHRQRRVLLAKRSGRQGEADHTVGDSQLLADCAGAEEQAPGWATLFGGMLDASTRYSRSGSRDVDDFQSNFMMSSVPLARPGGRLERVAVG